MIDRPINDQLEHDQWQAAAVRIASSPLFQMATSLESTTKLNDGVDMPLFGLGVYQIEQNCT